MAVEKFNNYNTAVECLLYFPKDCFEVWKREVSSMEFEDFVNLSITDLIEPPTEEIIQQNGIKKIIPIWKVTTGLAKDLKHSCEKIWNEYINSAEYMEKTSWKKFKVAKTSDEDFKSVLHELTYKLDPKEEIMMGYWLWQSINKLRGNFPEMPTFLGLVGKPGDGKDFTLGQFQLALGVESNPGQIPDGYSMSIFDENFVNRDFYTQGIVRFEEISARRKSDIDTFKTKITNPMVMVKEKFKEPFSMLSRNSYCGTANESFQCMVNDVQNRRIIEINWKSVKGEVSKKQVREIFERLIACCPEEEIYDEDEVFTYIHEQFDGDITIDKIWSSDELREFLTTSSRVRVGQIKQYLKCSFAEARKFLRDERFFEYIETGHYYKIDTLKLLDELNAE